MSILIWIQTISHSDMVLEKKMKKGQQNHEVLIHPNYLYAAEEPNKYS